MSSADLPSHDRDLQPIEADSDELVAGQVVRGEDVVGREDDVGEAPADVEERGFLPAQPDRRTPESVLVRLVATAGVVGIGTALGAILGANDVAGWIVGLAVSGVSVILAAILWRSRTL